ncbi:MAG: DUF1934 domain-containing protein [Clostridia bacterium]|nr:DUF1934 domain-containing protein [Clostridia bacterium]
MAAKFDKLPVDGTPVKLTVSSVIYENAIPDSLVDIAEADEIDNDEDTCLEEADSPQKLEQVTVASYSELDGRVTVTYDDSEILDMPETLTQITFKTDEPGCVCIVRSGALRSMVTVEAGKTNMGEYSFGPYTMPIAFYGRRVVNTVKDGVGTIELDYTVEISGSDTSHTKMKLTLEKLPASPL